MNENIFIEHAKQLNDVAAAMIEMEAMKVANKLAEIEKSLPVYNASDFQKLLELYELGYNSNIIKSRRFY